MQGGSEMGVDNVANSLFMYIISINNVLNFISYCSLSPTEQHPKEKHPQGLAAAGGE